jgi:thioredoxin-like negative regulator of GroEL
MTELTSQEIREKINNGDKFLLDFYAVWCGPCRVLMKILSDSEELLNVPVYTYNVDTDRNFTQEFNVRSVPTVKLFDGGKVVNSGSGVMNINQLQSFVS